MLYNTLRIAETNMKQFEMKFENSYHKPAWQKNTLVARSSK